MNIYIGEDLGYCPGQGWMMDTIIHFWNEHYIGLSYDNYPNEFLYVGKLPDESTQIISQILRKYQLRDSCMTSYPFSALEKLLLPLAMHLGVQIIDENVEKSAFHHPFCLEINEEIDFNSDRIKWSTDGYMYPSDPDRWDYKEDEEEEEDFTFEPDTELPDFDPDDETEDNDGL